MSIVAYLSPFTTFIYVIGYTFGVFLRILMVFFYRNFGVFLVFFFSSFLFINYNEKKREKNNFFFKRYIKVLIMTLPIPSERFYKKEFNNTGENHQQCPSGQHFPPKLVSHLSFCHIWVTNVAHSNHRWSSFLMLLDLFH